MIRSIGNLRNMATNEEELEEVDRIRKGRNLTKIFSLVAVTSTVGGAAVLQKIAELRDATQTSLSWNLYNNFGQVAAFSMGGAITLGVFAAGIFGYDSHKRTNNYLNEHKEAVRALRMKQY